MKSSQKYYVVWKGRKTGVFASWEECKAQVDHFENAEYKSFSSLKAAQLAYQGRYEDYKGKPAFRQGLMEVPPPVEESWSVDAACSGNPGNMEYQGVHTGNGKRIFHAGPITNGTNNIGEFLAIVHALGLLQKMGLNLPIYSDSETAQAWVKAKKCKTELPEDESTREVFAMIRRAEEWLRTYSYTNEIRKWDTAAWGQIPADFGRK